MAPGYTVNTRSLSFFHSSRRDFASPATACLDAQYAADSGKPILPAVEDKKHTNGFKLDDFSSR